MENVIFTPRRAIILFDSPVTDSSIATLVERIHAVSQELYYRDVELQILSPGGTASSLMYYVAALEAFEGNLVITTRALTAVSSASAIMLSLGDHRRASTASQLLYHNVRLPNPQSVTARDAHKIHAHLEGTDKYFIGLLVRRGLRIPESDWAQRWNTPSNDSESKESAAFGIPKRDRWIAILCSSDPRTKPQRKLTFLTKTYAHVFAVDQPISARLARKIGLIDVLDNDSPRFSPDFSPSDVKLGIRIPEWTTILPPDGRFELDSLKRHVLILGETGSGKTASGIMPLLRAIVDSSGHSDERRVSCALVIDPKRELAEAIRSMGGRCDIIGSFHGAPPVFNLMEQTETPEDPVDHATAILTRVGGLAYCQASTLLGKEYGGSDPYWAHEGTNMAKAALAAVLLVLELQGAIYAHDGSLIKELLPAEAAEAAEDEKKTEDEKKEAKKEQAAREKLAAALEKFAEEAGFSMLTTQANRRLKVNERSMQEMWRRYQDATGLLRQHGFIVRRLTAKGAEVEEIRGWSFKIYDLDVFTSWQVAQTEGGDVSGLWKGVQNTQVCAAFGLDIEEAKDWLKDCGPPLETMRVEGEHMNTLFGDEKLNLEADQELRVMVSVPVLFRDAAKPTDREKFLAIMDVCAEIGKTAIGCDKRPDLARLERGLLEGLHKLKTKYDPDRRGVKPSTASLVLMTMLRWLDEMPSFAGARELDESFEGETGQVEGEYRFREWAPPESLAEYGEDDCGYTRCFRLADDDWYSYFQYYDCYIAGGSCAVAVTCAIEHAKELGAILDKYGAVLCGIMLGAPTGEEEEWARRVQGKVDERNGCIKRILSVCEEVRQQVDKKACLLARKPRQLFMPSFMGEQATRPDAPEPLFGSSESVADGMERGRLSYLTHLERFKAEHRLVEEDGRLQKGLNVIALADFILKETFNIETIGAWRGLFARLEGARADGPELDVVVSEKLRMLVDYFARMANTLGGQYTGVYSGALGCFSLFSEARVARMLYFGCEPYWKSIVRWEESRVVRFSERLNKEGQTIFVVQPDLRDGADLVGRCIKAMFFESVLRDKRRRQPGHGMPLVAYVADEFHRFITPDRAHGEQSFLDTCRSFGAFCVLACQATSSMAHALGQIESDNSQIERVISIILNNTGTKLFFRTTDRNTMEALVAMAPVPSRPGMANVIHVRPLSTLSPGECYAVLVTGRFVRAQLEQWNSSEDGRRAIEG